MKVIYSFMIGLILFNFYACTKQQIEEPLTENAKLEITYLDEKNNPTEKRTDNILMKLKDDESGFIMVSRKTGENEYTDYLIDNINNSTISMYYTNKSNFPYKIVVIQEGVSMVGYTSEYREDTKDFDIVWEMLNGSTTEYETFANISATNLFNHAKTSGVDENTDYQIMTLKVSVRIADAINKYVDDNFEDNPITRGFWSKFCNFWKKVFKPIVRVVTIIVAVFVPPVAAIITTVVKVADAIINTIDNAINKTEEAVKVSSGPKKLYILKNNNGDYKNASNQYTNTESIYLKSSGATTNIIFKVTDAKLGGLKGYASVSNESINATDYYEFKDTKGKSYSINSEKQLLSLTDADIGNLFNLVAKRKVNKMGYIVFIDIKLQDNIFVNDKAGIKDFRLILQQDEN
ncbi:hypothetical protein EPJ79_04275 [Brachyspira aalborgi]|uniref:Uncharacterized protein n=1 Tax=Brachyspira aalborgi TaxID=29522 RepID=A0A5C8D7E8_9SPIR|nr:hypothetical protein [Brachyspira aalborgi]TXJ20371.1 hypothetical protein EPJ79_04275 [Brachyspira aalborgi]